MSHGTKNIGISRQNAGSHVTLSLVSYLCFLLGATLLDSKENASGIMLDVVVHGVRVQLAGAWKRAGADRCVTEN